MSDAQHTPSIANEHLRDIGLFGGLSDEALAAFTADLTVQRVEPGTMVMREGDTAREMFVVIGGELEVLKHGPRDSEGRVAVLGPGDWVGDMSIIDVQPRSASVRAVAPSLLLCIRADDLDRLYRRDLKSYTLFVLNIARELSRRLRVADGIVAGFLATVHAEYLGPAAPMGRKSQVG